MIVIGNTARAGLAHCPLLLALRSVHDLSEKPWLIEVKKIENKQGRTET